MRQYIRMAKMKLFSTPPAMTKSRCQAGLVRNSQLCGSRLSCSRSIDSSGNLAIAAERYPAYAELGLAPVPACQRLTACVEEQIKLLDPDSKNPGPHEMSQLVHYDEQREGEYYLKGFN